MMETVLKSVKREMHGSVTPHHVKNVKAGTRLTVQLQDRTVETYFYSYFIKESTLPRVKTSSAAADVISVPAQ